MQMEFHRGNAGAHRVGIERRPRANILIRHTASREQ
jgi:hypothetical protein